MEAALVTGAQGFLGTHIVASISRQYQVYTLGKNHNNNYPVDLSKSIPALKTNVAFVVHAAGLAHKKQVSDEDMFAVNLAGTKNLCAAFDNLKQYPKVFVFLSTVAVYGLTHGENIVESTPLLGTTSYAKSKIAAEEFITGWCQKNNIVCTILRLPLVAGKNAPGNILAMKNAIAANSFFIPGKGDARKSIVLASDVADIIPKASALGGVYHLTDGRHPTFKDVALLLANSCNKKKVYRIPLWLCRLLAVAGDTAGNKFPFNSGILTQLTSTLTFSDTSAKKAFGWKPKAIKDFNDW